MSELIRWVARMQIYALTNTGSGPIWKYHRRRSVMDGLCKSKRGSGKFSSVFSVFSIFFSVFSVFFAYFPYFSPYFPVFFSVFSVFSNYQKWSNLEISSTQIGDGWLVQKGAGCIFSSVLHQRLAAGWRKSCEMSQI